VLLPVPPTLADLEAGFANRPSLLHSLDLSLDYLTKPSSWLSYPRFGISHALMERSLRRFRALLVTAHSPREFAEKVRSEFNLLAVNPNPEAPEVLITGYYHPVFRASLTPSETYRYPLYRRPVDLVLDESKQPLGRRTAEGLIAPYPTRAEIEQKNLLTGQELIWLADPLERFLVHIEGSATLKLPDGSLRHVGFVAKSGRPYSSIGKALIADGKIPKEQMSLSALKDYFRRNPQDLETYLYKNEAYVFFDWTDGRGPYGSLGMPVTAMHSAAMDKSIFPPGALLFIQAQLADGPLRQFVLDQDAGSAIVGPGRLDLFVGTGEQAEEKAGRIKHPAQLFYLLLKK
jgi:membrane-bound lytic murein transglycosylase A